MAGLAVLGSALAAWSAPMRHRPSSASNKAAARSDARMLLSKLVLPAGSTRLSSEPAGDHSVLAGTSHPGTPNLADAHGWWRVPGTVDDVIAFVKAHRPSGAGVDGTAGGSGPGYSWAGVTFNWPARRGVLSIRWLVIEVAPLADGSTGVRADGESVWVTPRPSAEQVPPANRVRITVTRADRIVQGPIVVRSLRKVRRLSALLNALPAAQPFVAKCPLDRGIRVVLDFFSSSSSASPVAQATIVVGGCGGVALTLHGHPQPGLGASADLLHRVAAVIGRRLKTR